MFVKFAVDVVELSAVRFVMPVEPSKETEVALAPLANVTATFSTPETLVKLMIAPPDGVVKFKVSMPDPPLIVSLEPRVCAPVEVKAPSKKSLPAVPAKLFAPVVSGQVKHWRKALILKALLLFLIRKLRVTHQPPISDLFSRGVYSGLA